MIEGSGSPAPNRAVMGGEAMKALIVYYSMYGRVNRMHVATLTAKLVR